MSGFVGRKDTEALEIDIQILRQLQDANIRGVSLINFIVDDEEFLISDNLGNFILPE